MDHVFAKQECDKFLTNGKDLFWAFMDLEKVDDSIDLHDMWQMLRMYGVEGKLTKALQNFYVDSKTLCPGGK